MASLSQDKDGTRRLLFVVPGGQRRTIRLGRMALRDAERLKAKVEQLVIAAKTGNTLDAEVALWASRLSPEMHAKLAAAGLLAKREAKAETKLQGFLDGYIAARVDIKPATATVLGHTKRNLIEFFGTDRELSDIAAGEADDFRLYLIEQELGSNTVARRCSIAKQFFRAAKRRRLISENPFEDLGASVKGNPEKFYFVSQAEAQAVLDACPDHEWRVLFALARFAGLRTPSESLGLRWSDVDWERSRLRVTSPKTSHHDGKGERLVPIFPRLAPYLTEAFELAEPGSEYIITRYRDPSVNLRTQLHRIIAKAGLTPWPKTWQNLRSTCQTELVEQFPAHVAAAWIGNSTTVAARHYLQVTEEHFRLATAERAHKRAQYGAESDGNGEQAEGEQNEKCRETASLAHRCHGILGGVVGGTGLEPVTSTV